MLCKPYISGKILSKIVSYKITEMVLIFFVFSSWIINDFRIVFTIYKGYGNVL